MSDLGLLVCAGRHEASFKKMREKNNRFHFQVGAARIAEHLQSQLVFQKENMFKLDWSRTARKGQDRAEQSRRGREVNIEFLTQFDASAM